MFRQTSFSFSIYLSLPPLSISFHFLSTSSLSIYLSLHSLYSFSFFIYMFLLYLTLHSLSDVLYVPLSRLSIFSSSSIYFFLLYIFPLSLSIESMTFFRIRASDLSIRIVLFSSLTFKKPTKSYFFQVFLFITFWKYHTFTSLFKDKKP